MESRQPQPAPSKRKTVLWLALGLLGVLGLAFALGLLLILPRVVRAVVIRSAAERGVVLDPGELAFGIGWVQLDHAKLSLAGVRSLTLDVARVDIALSGMTPDSIELSGVDTTVTGSISNVALELSDWLKSHSDTFSLPFTAKSLSAHFLENAGEKPWLEVSGGTLSRSASGGVFNAERATLAGVSLGKVGAGFSQTSSSLSLGFGETDPARARVRIDVSPKATPPSAHIALAPTPAEELEKPLGLSFSVSGVKASATVDLTFPGGADEGAVNGKTHILLDGYVPPHPLELDGFIFGNTTSFDTDFALPKIRDRVLLSKSVLQAGAFVLRGGGLISRSSDHSEMALELGGTLPCDALAGASAQSRLAKLLGTAFAGRAADLARHLVSGSVSVGLSLHVDSKNFAAVRIDRQIGVGCGLRPLSLAELAKLMPLPSDLQDLVSSLPSLAQTIPQLAPPSLLVPGLPSNLPALPTAFPPLPTALPPLPTFNLPLPPLPSAKPPSKSPAPGASG